MKKKNRAFIKVFSLGSYYKHDYQLLSQENRGSHTRLPPNGRQVVRGACDLPSGTKISNREPERAAETYDFQANCL